MGNITLRVNEIFYSLCGEGARAGEASIFIRLQGCSAKHACAASGVVCDTEFESGKEMTLFEILMGAAEAMGRATKGEGVSRIDSPADPTAFMWIVWTGGEPLDQLTFDVIKELNLLGYKQAIETSGIKPLSQEMANMIHHITVSPKVAEHVLKKNFGHLERRDDDGKGNLMNVDELRYVRHAGQPGVPIPSLKAQHYYLSPHSEGAEINQENLKHCIKLCLENPQWKLSTQQHKLWGVL